jgi:hypothetical protein
MSRLDRMLDAMTDADAIALFDHPHSMQGPPDLTNCVIANGAPMPSTELTEEQWADTYRPTANPHDPNAAWDGLMFETYGPELDTVHSTPTNHVWTYVEGENGTYLVSGYHWVNRIGYFICEEPAAPDIWVRVSKDCEQCGYALQNIEGTRCREC